MMDQEVKRTHSLSYLLDLLSEKVVITSEIYEFAECLQDYAVGIRYPDDEAEPTEQDAEQAYQAAVSISIFLESLLATMEHDK